MRISDWSSDVCSSALELRVEAFLCLLQDFGRQVGGDDLDAPAGQARGVVLQHHGKGIRLLPARAGGAPDADLLAAGARLQQVRQHDILELLERPVIAEKERPVGERKSVVMGK